MNSHSSRNEFSAGKGLVLGFGATAVLLAGVLGWSVMASVSGAVISSGVVGVESGNLVIEHIDGGTVWEIQVGDGDQVVKNQVLLRFSDEQLQTEEAILLGQFVELAARRNRLETEFHGENTIQWDEDLIEIVKQNPAFKKILNGQESLFQARIAARNGEVSQIREQIGQAHNEIAALESRNESLKQQSLLVAQELEAEQALFEKGLTRLPRLLAVKRAAENLKGLVGSNDARIASLRGSISELEVQILLIDLLRVEEAESTAREVSAQENQIKEQLGSIAQRLNRLEVKAPVSGVVLGNTVFAPGEVVFPGEPILQIVPDDASLVVIAKIQPIDIDQVHLGQQAILRFSAFPARVTPEYYGQIKRVSADVVIDETTGISYYEVELTLDELVSVANGEIAPIVETGSPSSYLGGLNITPGMPVEVHIRTTERTVISYLMKPVTDFFYRSFREE